MDKYLVRSSSTESLGGKRPAEDQAGEWIKPKRVARPSGSRAGPKFASENTFKKLPVDNNEDQAASPYRNASTRKAAANKIPPILLEVKSDLTHETIKAIVKKYTNTFHMAYRGASKVAISCHSASGHKLLKDGLRTENIPFYTYGLKEERTAKVVIRGLPACVEGSIKDELAELGFTDITVIKLGTKSESTACPLFLINLPAGADVIKFRKIKYLCSCAIEVLKYKPNRNMVTQCFRCQGFGHTSKHCNLNERCVKCVDDHATKDCVKKDRSLPAQCCNCKEQHPSNYRQCVARLKYLEAMQKKRETSKLLIKPPVPAKVFMNPNVDGRPWNQVAAARPKHTTPMSIKTANPEDISMSSDGKLDAETAEILSIFKAIKAIKGQFSMCKSNIDKVLLVLTHLGQYA